MAVPTEEQMVGCYLVRRENCQGSWQGRSWIQMAFPTKRTLQVGLGPDPADVKASHWKYAGDSVNGFGGVLEEFHHDEKTGRVLTASGYWSVPDGGYDCPLVIERVHLDGFKDLIGTKVAGTFEGEITEASDGV